MIQVYIYIYTHSFFNIFPLLLGYWIWFFVLYSRTLLYIPFAGSNLHLLTPNSHSSLNPLPQNNHKSILCIFEGQESFEGEKKSFAPKTSAPSLSIFNSWGHAFANHWHFLSSEDFPSLPSQRFLHAWTGGLTSQDLHELHVVGLSRKVVLDEGVPEACRMFSVFPVCCPIGSFVSTKTTSTTEEGFSSGSLSICCVVKMLGQCFISCYFPFLRMTWLNTEQKMSHSNSSN